MDHFYRTDDIYRYQARDLLIHRPATLTGIACDQDIQIIQYDNIERYLIYADFEREAMAVDPEKFGRVRRNLDEIIEMTPGKAENKEFIIKEVLGPALGEVEELIDDSRPPRLYVFGRSGAGKSSLINALANKEVAEVGTVEPTTVESNMYNVPFPEQYAEWDVIDSRGLFESVSPDGDVPADTVSFVKQDLEEYRPDILLHVMTPDQVRAGEDDFKTVQHLRDELGALFPPVVYCLNKVDTHLSPGGDWPPEENPTLSGDIRRNLDFVCRVLGEEDKTAIELGSPFRGYRFDSNRHVGVIPVFLKSEPSYWNIETLSWMVCDFLPNDARLQFAQAQQREELMRRMSRNITNRFSAIATTIGGAPAPVADIAILTPLQILLVMLIGSFSCREMSLSTAREYLGALGTTSVAGLAARGVARSLIQIVPGVGWAVSGAIAGGGTYAIGRSAEAYFFNGETIKPNEFLSEGKKRFSNKDAA